MAIIDSYEYTRESLEDLADVIKRIVVEALVEDDYLVDKEADEWCKNTTILLRKKSFFQTISNLWKKEESAKNGFIFIIVSKNRKRKPKKPT